MITYYSGLMFIGGWAKNPKIRLMKFIGLRTQDHPLHRGIYTGKATLLRTLPNGQVLQHTIESSVAVVNGDCPLLRR